SDMTTISRGDPVTAVRSRNAIRNRGPATNDNAGYMIATRDAPAHATIQASLNPVTEIGFSQAVVDLRVIGCSNTSRSIGVCAAFADASTLKRKNPLLGVGDQHALADNGVDATAQSRVPIACDSQSDE